MYTKNALYHKLELLNSFKHQKTFGKAKIPLDLITHRSKFVAEVFEQFQIYFQLHFRNQ